MKSSQRRLEIDVMEMGIMSVRDCGLWVSGTGVTYAVFQSAGHWLYVRQALKMEQKVMAISGPNSWYSLMGRPTCVVERLDLSLRSDLTSHF